MRFQRKPIKIRLPAGVRSFLSNNMEILSLTNEGASGKGNSDRAICRSHSIAAEALAPQVARRQRNKIK